MAIKDMCRFKPDMNRSTLESLVSGLDTSVTPATGTVYLPVQIVSWDDSDLPAAAYRPGNPDIEQFVTVLYEDTIQVALQGFQGMSAAAVLADLEDRLDAWAVTVKPAIPMLRRVIRAAKRIAPRALPA